MTIIIIVLITYFLIYSIILFKNDKMFSDVKNDTAVHQQQANQLETNIRELLLKNIVAKAYMEPHRKYHNEEHIFNCFNLYTTYVPSDIEDYTELAFAIIFHDIVYDTQSKDNEEKSAAFMKKVLQDFDPKLYPDQFCNKIADMIMHTKHTLSTKYKPIAYQYMIDIDLSILGESEATFDAYDKDIREEYSWVPEEIYKVERKKILQSFLDRKCIYETETFRNLFEEQARKNLSKAIERLGN